MSSIKKLPIGTILKYGYNKRTKYIIRAKYIIIGYEAPHGPALHKSHREGFLYTLAHYVDGKKLQDYIRGGWEYPSYVTNPRIYTIDTDGMVSNTIKEILEESD